MVVPGLPTLKLGEEFVCDNGCGSVVPEQYDFEFSREELPNGEVVSKTVKAWRAPCCRAEVTVYSSLHDTFTSLDDYVPAVAADAGSAPDEAESCAARRARLSRKVLTYSESPNELIGPLTEPNALPDPPVDVNQCDGCLTCAPLTERGLHRMTDGGLMACTKDRYQCADRALASVLAGYIDADGVDRGDKILDLVVELAPKHGNTTVGGDFDALGFARAIFRTLRREVDAQ